MKYLTRTTSIALFVAIIALGAFIAIAKPFAERGTISVTVLDDATNQPIKGATIEVIETHQKAKTDASGLASIKVIVSETGANVFSIKADHPQYLRSTQQSISVIANNTTNVNFRLQAGVDLDDKKDYEAKPLSSMPYGAPMSRMKSAYGMGRASGSYSVGFAPDGLEQNFTPREEHNTEEYSKINENEFKSSKDHPLSTFSIDVDNASYSNVRRFITQGSTPPKDAVRIEEMINYFKYEYPQPTSVHPFSITTEMAECPWNTKHQVVLVGLQGKDIAKENLPPVNLVFLLDVSGSMQDPNKLPLVKKSLRLLVDQLRPQDRVAIAVYAGNAGLVLPSTSGNDKKTILAALDNLEAGGSTAGGAGIKLAYQTARDNKKENGNNRVILCTDGDFNVGASSDGELVRMIEKEREDGIFLTVLGFGMGNYKDSKMEQLADKGNGNYGYIDNLLEAQKMLVTQMGGTLNTIAKDVKIQIEFNPTKIAGYRLIGYENRLLAKEDFNNDKKDAGELGSGHTVTAIYEIVPVGANDVSYGNVDPLKYQHNDAQASTTDEMMTVKFRYKEPKDSVSKLIVQPVQSSLGSLTNASNNLRFATSVAEFGMLLTDSKFKGTTTVDGALSHARSARGSDNEGYRAEFIKLIEMYKLLNKAER